MTRAGASTRRWPITRRSAFLMLFGFGYSVIGWSYLVGPPAPALEESLHLTLSVLPLQVFGALWLGCGLLAITTGVTRWHKPAGFAALTGIGLLWGCCYFIGWLAHDAATGYRTAAIFWTISAGVHIVAGMVDGGRR